MDGELAYVGNTTSAAQSTSGPTIADTLNLSTHSTNGSTNPVTFTYTVPSGSNQVLIVLLAHGGGTVPTATLNGQSITMVHNVGNGDCNNMYASNEYVGYLNNPTSGTFSLNKGGAYVADFVVFTVNDADISGNPIDAYYCTAHSPGSANIAVSTTTPSANDLIVDWGVNGGIYHFIARCWSDRICKV